MVGRRPEFVELMHMDMGEQNTVMSVIKSREEKGKCINPMSDTDGINAEKAKKKS